MLGIKELIYSKLITEYNEDINQNIELYSRMMVMDKIYYDVMDILIGGIMRRIMDSLKDTIKYYDVEEL